MPCWVWQKRAASFGAGESQLHANLHNKMNVCDVCVCVGVCVSVPVLLVCPCVHCTLVCAATEGYIGAYKHKISCCLPQKVQKKRSSNIANFTKRRRKTSQLFLHTVISSTFQSQIPWQEMNVINAASNDANYSIWMWMCACEYNWVFLELHFFSSI